jgi:putative ATP-dependent endonuclease of OLD family
VYQFSIAEVYQFTTAADTVVFEEGPGGGERGIDALSDGQQSLFYFALAAAVFDVERAAVSGQVQGFNRDNLTIPALTIFAIEEPENHLSPYYLARIIRQLRTMVEGGAAQALLTSHSPSVLSRVPPEDVRYCHRNGPSRASSVVAITLPPVQAEAAKFVRSAMLAFPELYFARFVLLVEGDSERIVLPRLAEALGFMVDPSFVAIVPLGGRHVQHFWHLLNGLGIPHATLLDLDLGREGGGFGRVKTALQNLLALGVDRRKILGLQNGTVLDDIALNNMHAWSTQNIDGWLSNLEQSANVFFCWPLDLDLAMLDAFPQQYKSTITGTGPRMSPPDAAQVVLGSGGPGLTTYVGDLVRFVSLMPEYRYHFLTHSKPATHISALANISPQEIQSQIPAHLRRVLEHIQNHLSGL